MKVTIELDCTPLEARKLLGLPDVAPMQAAMMKQLEERMGQAMSITDPESLMKQWAPLGLQSLEQFQKALWNAAMPMAQEQSKKG